LPSVRPLPGHSRALKRKRRIELLPLLDPPPVPSLGVQLRAPPGGDVCSLARRISGFDEGGCLYEACLRLFGVLKPPLLSTARLHLS